MQALPDGAGTGAHLSCKRREGNEDEGADEKEEALERMEDEMGDEADEVGEGGGARTRAVGER